ncbi:TPA: glycosyltransferase [Streptococcus suis]
MKIVFIGNFSGGGVDSACFNLVNRLADYHSITLISTGFLKPSLYLREDIKFYHISNDSILKMNHKCFKILKQLSPDIVIALEALTGIISILPTIFLGKKYIVWEHANYYQNQGRWYIQIVRAIELILANAYVVLTKRDLKTFQKKFLLKRRLRHIYNLFDKNNRVEYCSGSKLIISAGHLRPIKNFESIPEIASIALKNHPDWKWKIYGAGSEEYMDFLNKKIQDFGVVGQVEFCGRTDYLSDIMLKSAIYVLPSYFEGLPMVLLEAKSYGLPIISFDIETGPDEIIKDNVNGYLISPFDLKEMSEKIKYLIENADVRKEFSNKSFIDLHLFSKEEVVKNWLELIEEVNE